MRRRSPPTIRKLALSLLCALVLACRVERAPATGPRHPFPQHVVYTPGTLRPNQRSQAQQDGDVRAFYEHWKAGYLVQAGTTPAGHPLYRVSFGSTNPGRTVSEGQGFGMIIVALMAGHDAQAQAIFDSLLVMTGNYWDPSTIGGGGEKGVYLPLVVRGQEALE